MQKNLTHLVFLVDRSGSMWSIKDSMNEAINGLIKKQRQEPGQCTVSIYEFDSNYEGLNLTTTCENTLIGDVPEFNLEPNGGTPLIDAGCVIIDNVGRQLAYLPESERPGKVIFTLVTDGGENSSKKYQKEELVGRIEKQKNQFKWTIMFLGANQNAIKEAAKYGIKQEFAISYAASSAGVESVTSALSGKVSRMRGMSDHVYGLNAVSGHACSFDAADREEQTNLGAVAPEPVVSH